MSLTRYKVGDLIIEPSALTVLMILESPHINEYIHEHPAAGESALELTQLLQSQGYIHDFNSQLPVGCNIEALKYTPLGILNCSHFPMNPDFYPCAVADDEQAAINNLIEIKQQLNQHSQKSLPFDLSSTEVFKDFAARLTQVLIQAPDVIIVPCGDTAKGFIDAFTTTYSKPLHILYGLPHPTEPDWDEKINCICLADHIAPQLLP